MGRVSKLTDLPLLVFLALTALILVPLSAGAAGGGGLYLAAGFGSSDADDSTLGLAVDDSDTSLRLLVGLRLLDNWAVEGGYIDFGDFDSRTGNGVDADGIELGVRYQYEFSPHWYFQARGGALLWDIESRQLAGNVRLAEDGQDPYFGVGIRWEFADHWEASADLTRYVTDDLDFDHIGLTFYRSIDF